MKCLEELNKLLSEHFDTEKDSTYTDRALLIKLRDMVKRAIADEKIKVVADGVEQARPKDIYRNLLASMTPQKLASLGVKLVLVNKSELFWVTSVGQLYSFDDKERALQDEYQWLMSNFE
jgi:hypothetical protein